MYITLRQSLSHLHVHIYMGKSKRQLGTARVTIYLYPSEILLSCIFNFNLHFDSTKPTQYTTLIPSWISSSIQYLSCKFFILNSDTRGWWLVVFPHSYFLLFCQPSTVNVYHIYENCGFKIWCVYLCMYYSPFREQNDTCAVNRTCERFCACDSHACLSH